MFDIKLAVGENEQQDSETFHGCSFISIIVIFSPHFIMFLSFELSTTFPI